MRGDRGGSYLAQAAWAADPKAGLMHQPDLTSQWSRRPTAYARSSLPLSGAAHRWRSTSLPAFLYVPLFLPSNLRHRCGGHSMQTKKCRQPGLPSVPG
jgi:hypothetical protein